MTTLSMTKKKRPTVATKFYKDPLRSLSITSILLDSPGTSVAAQCSDDGGVRRVLHDSNHGL